MVIVSPVSHDILETSQLAPLTPSSFRVTCHSAGEGWTAPALPFYPLYQAGVEAVGHSVHIALTL